MGVILAVGLCTAALREATELWAGAALLVVLVFLAAAILQAIHKRSASRAFWLGFALFGWGYLLLVMSPWFSDHLGAKLPTSLLLEQIHQNVGGGQSQANSTWLVATSTNGTWQPSASTGQLVVHADTSAPPPQGNRYLRMFFIGASHHDPFLRTGHSIFALFAALLGASISLWIYRRAENHVPASESTPH